MAVKKIFSKNGAPSFSLTSKSGNKIEVVVDVDSSLHLFINGRYKNSIMNNNDNDTLYDTIKTYVDTADNLRVSKVANKSLILDTEIVRLASVTNQTLSSLGVTLGANDSGGVGFRSMVVANV
jgi:hypothetical protein